MTNQITGLLAILMLVGQSILAQCPSGDVTLTTQTEIDNFGTSYPSCSIFSGNITVHGDNVYDVDGLISLQNIHGNLIIKNSKNLTNLDGLINLTSVGGKLEIKGCNKLNSLEGLNNLTNIGGSMTIMQNDILSDCTGLCTLLDNIGVVGTIKIQHNDTECNSENDIKDECALIPLPVEIISFQVLAVERANKLKWQTASEKNTMEFIVERSENGKNDFREINRINAAGNTDLTQNYEIKDNAPSNMAYYRLKIIDFDGYIEYSNLIFIKRSTIKDSSVEIFPVPTKDEATVLISMDDYDSATLTLTDFTGRILRQEKVELNSGLNRFMFNLNEFNTNLYFLSIDNGKEKIVKKLLKVNLQ